MFGLSKYFKKRSLGEWGEDYIAKQYMARGYRILNRNFFNRRGKRLGEIDFIAIKGRELAFVEVKTRTSQAYGRPAESVNWAKQQRLLRACKYFLVQNPDFQNHTVRIDVAELVTDLDRKTKTVNILENAVEDTL